MKRKVSILTFAFTLIAILMFGTVIHMITGWNTFAVSGIIFALAFIGGAIRNYQGKAFERGILADFDIQDTTYTGTVEASYMITQATFGLATVQEGVAYVKDGIKKKHNIPKIDIVNPLQKRQPIPVQDPSKKAVVTGVVLDPQDIMGYEELNPRDWESHFYAEQLNQTLIARELPVTVANYLMQLYLNRCFEKIELGLHQGSLTYTVAGDPNGQISFFDGLIKKALTGNGTDLSLQVGSPAVLTISNIQTQMQAAYELVPKGILANAKRRANLKYLVSVEDDLIYEDYITTSRVYKNNDDTERGIRKYKGIPIVVLPGLPKDTFYLCEAIPDITTNIWIGTNSMEDLQIMFMKLQNNSELWFFKALFKFDVQIAKYNEFVIHTTKVIGDFSV
jgi:hypothetical protein